MNLSFITAAGTALTIARKNIKIIFFANIKSGRLRVDSDATARGKQDTNAQGRRMVQIYMAIMHAASALSPDMCTKKISQER